MARDWVKTVRDLRRRANKHPDTPEAEASLAKAAEVMKKHGLTEDDVSDAAVEKEVTEIAEGRIDDLRVELARAIAHAYGCAVVGNGRQLGFRGAPEVVNGARNKYSELCAIADAASQMSTAGGPPQAAREAWRICWWFGFTAAVDERLSPPKRPPPPSPSASAVPQSEGVDTTAVGRAMQAMQQLADAIADEVDDVMAVIERLRQHAFLRGRMVGLAVNLDVVRPGQKLLR